MDDADSLIEELILNGALEVAGIDMETGAPLYNFTENLVNVNPDLHKDFMTYLSRETMSLWSDGFLDLDVTERNPMVSLTEKALNDSEVSKLSKEKQYTLKEIIRVITLDNK